MKNVFLLAILVVLAGFAPLFAQAVNPSITSFTVSPNSASSGYFFAFLWSLENAYGSSFLVPCIQGIKLQYSNGSTLACGTRIASQAATNDGLGVKIINISGNTVSITARIIPKDSSGKDYDAGGQSLYVSVSPNTQPIEKFASSATTTTSGKPVTISWSSTDLDNINLSVECKPEIKVSSPSYAAGLYIPCGKPIFQPDLSKSGSLTLNFTNSSQDPIPYTITLIPAIVPGVYDGAHPANLTLAVASDIVPDPVVNYFKTSSPPPIYSGQTLPLSWTTENTNGVNLKISCADNVTATSSKNATSTLPCNSYAFADNDLLPATGSLNLSFQNAGNSLIAVNVSLIPAFKDKIGYDATKSKTLSVDIRPKSSGTVPATSSTGAQAPQISPMSPMSPTSTPKTQPPSPVPKPTAPALKPTPVSGPRVKAPPSYVPPKEADVELKKDLQSVEYVRIKFLFLIPVYAKIIKTTNAETGDVKNIKYPWWSYLGFIR